MVAESDAITDPGTVVIHLHDAFIADRAVVCPWWLQTLTFVAVLVLIYVLDGINGSMGW